MAEKKRQYRAFTAARLALVLLFISLWVTLLPFGYPMPTGFLIVLVAELATILWFRQGLGRIRTSKGLDRSHQALLVCELGFHTAIVYFLGGVSWLGTIAYLYALMYAAVFLSVRQAVAFTAAVAISFLTLVSLDGAGVLPHQVYLPQGPDRYSDPDYLVTTCVAFVGVAATVTFWMVFIGNEMRRERDIALNANTALAQTQTELWVLNQELENKVEERTRVLAYRAEHDQLTGLLNRGSVSRRCQEMIGLTRRGERQLALIVADVDNFKGCNDSGGHAYGDRVLGIMAECLQESCRESDLVGRLGGDEFLIVLPDTSSLGALRYCRRLQRALQQFGREWTENTLPFPTLSLGVAVFPTHGQDMEDLVRVADKAMYEAKAEGGARWKLGSFGAVFAEAPRVKVTEAGPS